MTKHWLMLFVVGCGGGGGSHAPIALTDLGAQLGTTYCMKEFECCTAAEIKMDFGSFTVGGQPVTTEPQCETFYGGFYNALVSTDYMTSIANGRVIYDANAAAGCIDALDGLSCAEFGTGGKLDNSTGCMQFIEPQVENGSACAQSYECKSNNCVGATTQPAKDGSCAAIPTAGQACDFTCAPGLFCDFSMNDTCQPAKANGGACTSKDDCASDFCDTSASPSVCADKPARCDGI
jgi:hypothetical protein